MVHQKQRKKSNSSPLRMLRAWFLSRDHPPRFEGTSSNPCIRAVLLSHWIRPGHDSYSYPTETEIQAHLHIRDLNVIHSNKYLLQSCFIEDYNMSNKIAICDDELDNKSPHCPTLSKLHCIEWRDTWKACGKASSECVAEWDQWEVEA